MNSVEVILYHVAKVFIFGVGTYTSALEHCRKMKVKIQLHLTLLNK